MRWYTILILLSVRFTCQELASSTTESVEFATKSSTTELNNTNEESSPEWRSNDSNEYIRSTGGKIYSVDLASLHKYRRNGIENIPENYYGRRYFPDFPQRYQPYENDLYQREKNRYHDEIYPAQIQGCSHMMRDASRFQHTVDNRNSGILQGWIGSGTRWHSKDDKRYESIPLQITTATPKITPSYHNRDIYGKYESNNYDRNNFNEPGGSKFYEQEYNKGQDSTNKIEYLRNREYNDRNTYQWIPSSPQHNRNNRILYYEYNLDDRRPHQHHEMNRICGIHSDYNCEPQWYNGASRIPQYNQRNFYTSNENYSRSNTPYSSKSMPISHELDTQFSGYFAEDSYRHRNEDGGRNNGQQSIGLGYVYSLDLPNDRRKVENPSVALMSQLPYSSRNTGYKRNTMNQLGF